MRLLLCLLFVASGTFANKSDNRRNKLPFVADAVGNTLPPPSNVPATVGSPVNLLTPDRYEFYTFDESGELVKRLMTLEEIQAIVAAGEDTEGLVTFANDNQPTVAFNVNPPPYTKIHNVVANVQNVLKAQIEAHKNKPPIQPTFDTPDVSDSWSLILPSIFGNTGVDIIPDKSSGAVTTPDTETLEDQLENEENLLSKEGDRDVSSSSTTKEDEKLLVTEKTHDKTTELPTTKIITTPTITSSTSNPPITTSTVIISTKQPVILSTLQSTAESYTQTNTTNGPRPTITKKNPTTSKPLTKTTTKINTPAEIATKKYVLSILNTTANEKINVDIQHTSNTISTTEKYGFERISTFYPVSTVAHVSDRTTQKPISSTKPTQVFASTTKRSVASTTTLQTTQMTKEEPYITTSKPIITTIASVTSKPQIEEKINLTTITTQSVSPSTTVSSTEFLTFDKLNSPTNENNPNVQYNPNGDSSNIEKYNDPLPLFDVAQSISQIASDLGGSYQPVPTTSDLLDTTSINVQDLESKENIDMDIPSGNVKETNIKVQETEVPHNDNFIQISTINPHNKSEDGQLVEKNNFNNTIKNKEQENQNEIANIIINAEQKVENATKLSTIESTTIDPILFESMGDLMSQVANEMPSIMNSEIKNDTDSIIITTEKIASTTVVENINDLNISTEILPQSSNNISSTTEKLFDETSEKETAKVNILETKSNISSDITEKVSNNNVTELSNNYTLEYNETSKEKQFVQISGFPGAKLESIVGGKNENKDNLTSIITDIKEQSTKKPNSMTVVEVTKFSEPMSKDITSTESTIVLSDLDIPATTTITKTESPSQTNKSSTKNKDNSINKKEKLPELLPKVDDYKKKIQKVNIDDEELLSERNNTWKLIPTLSPPKANEIPKDKVKSDNFYNSDSNYNKDIVLEFSSENQGLEVTTKYLEEDVARFTELFNELAFRYWNVIIEDIGQRRSFVFSPYSTFSMLAMIFMGARGATSGEMNEILKLDDMVTFNPHFTLKNISDSIETSAQSGVAVSAFIRELYSDRNKGKILTFYKERAQHFYNGHVEEVNFKLISDIIRRRTNLLVKRYTWGKIPEYMKTNNIVLQPPLAAFTANIFQTDCSGTSVDGRDGEMYFVVSPNVRQRRLVPVPAVVYKKGFLAGYDPVLDVTVAALGSTNTVISTLFLMPGQQGNVVHADDLEKLEQRLLEVIPTQPTWNRILRTLLPRIGLELQIPRFSHKSIFNASLTLKKMGLKDLFDGEHADLGGLNGPSKDLYLSDMIQLNTFVTCGEGVIGEQHHIEEYPENIGVAQKRRARWLNDWDEPRDYQRAFHDPHDISDAMHLPLHLRPRQARLPTRSTQPARLKYDRPFLYFVRHNPTGMILYFGRYNPRLLP